MFVRVHDVSLEMPGMMSQKILKHAMRMIWMPQAPGSHGRLVSDLIL